MPMHNWKRVPATIYHHFHQRWTIAICDALNAGMLPEGYSALVEQYSSGLYPDVLTVQRPSARPARSRKETMTLAPPRTRMVVQPREGRFHERANRITIRHHLGEVVSVIEVVSPGNKIGKLAVREFVAKAVDFLRRGINLLIVDPFPPGPQDSQSLHKLIWDEFDEDVPFELPADEPLLLVSYARPRRSWNSRRKRSSNRSASVLSYLTCPPGWTPICTSTCRSKKRTWRHGKSAQRIFNTSSNTAHHQKRTRRRLRCNPPPGPCRIPPADRRTIS